MGKLLEFKSKDESVNRVDKFLEELEILKELFIQDDIDKVVIIATGKELKCCSSSGITVEEAWGMCRNFIKNTKDYLD